MLKKGELKTETIGSVHWVRLMNKERQKKTK